MLPLPVPSASAHSTLNYALICFYFMCMHTLPVCLSLYHACAMLVEAGKVLDLLELEWQRLVSHHVGAGNQTVFPVRAISALNHGSISPAQLFLSSLNFFVFY